MGKHVFFNVVHGKIVCLIYNKVVQCQKNTTNTLYKGKSDVLQVNLKEDKLPLSATAAKL
jgi:hypothetical protein